MMEYTKPQIIFDKLLLFEKIADSCWNSKAVFFNDPSEDEVDCNIETWIALKKPRKCNSDDLDRFLCGVSSYFNQTYANGNKRYESWYKDNIEGRSGIFSNTRSNWAYTPVS